MSKPKIIHIDTEMSWRGGQRQATYLYEGLLDKGFETIFFTKHNSAISKYLKNKNIQVQELSFASELDILSAYKLAKFAKKGNYNILVCHNAHSVTTALLAKIFYSKLKIVVVRRVIFAIKSGFISKYKYQNKLINRFVAISNAIKIVLEKSNINKQKVDLIYDGIDLKRFDIIKNCNLEKEINPNNYLIVGTTSALDKAKDFPTFLEAVKIILQTRKDVLFVIVGDGAERDNIQKEAENRNISQYIHFAGFQEHIGEYLKMFDVFTLFSKSEGLGTSILDAMSVGLPIVATNVGGIPEVVEHNYNGFLVNKSDPKELASAILELLNNEEKRKIYGQNSLQKVKIFDIKETIENYIKLFDELYDELLNAK